MPDVAYALAAVTGRADFRIDGDTPPAPRIGVATQDFAGPPEPDSAAALEAAVKAAETAARACARSLPAVLGEAWTIHPTLQDYEARQALAWEYATHRDLVAPQLRKLLDEAQAIEPRRYDEARRTARRARGALGEIFGGVDVLLTFSAPGPAPETLKATGNARFNRLWTLMGVPCVSVPGYENAAGLPVGVQVIAPFGRDALALAAARFVERALAGKGSPERLIPRPAAAYPVRRRRLAAAARRASKAAVRRTTDRRSPPLRALLAWPWGTTGRRRMSLGLRWGFTSKANIAAICVALAAIVMGIF